MRVEIHTLDDRELVYKNVSEAYLRGDGALLTLIYTDGSQTDFVVRSLLAWHTTPEPGDAERDADDPVTEWKER